MISNELESISGGSASVGATGLSQSAFSNCLYILIIELKKYELLINELN